MKKIFATVLFVFIAVTSYAQLKGSSIYIGGVIPYNGHTFGAVVGYKYQFALPVEGLGVIINADFSLDGSSQKVIRANQDAYDMVTSSYNFDTEDSKVSLHNPVYFNIPVRAGVNYSYPIKNIRLWAETSFGLNMVFRSNLSYSAYRWYGNEISGQSGERHYYATTKYKPGFAFAWNTGIGVLLKDRYSIGLALQGVGKYKLKSVLSEDYKRYYNSSSGSFVKDTELEKVTVRSSVQFQIRFGFHF